MRLSVIFKVIYVAQSENRCPMGSLSTRGLSMSGDFSAKFGYFPA